MATLMSDRLRFAIDIVTLLLNYLVKRLSEVRTAPSGVMVTTSLSAPRDALKATGSP
jgi:hypothetical protein